MSDITTNQIREYAFERHKYHSNSRKPQMYNGFHYIYHLTHVALNLKKFGFMSESLEQAAYLHDVLEDTRTTRKDLETFGVSEEVIDIVERVTDGPEGDRRQKKADMYPRCRENRKAIIVKLCDRIANLEEAIKVRSKHLHTYSEEAAEFEGQLHNDLDPFEPLWAYLNLLYGIAEQDFWKEARLVGAVLNK